MSNTKVVLIFGAGANTGLATVKKFANEGYKVAAVTRHPSEELKKSAHLIVPADLKDPTQIEAVFKKVTEELGPVHVVIYNAYDVQMVNAEHPLQVSVQRITETLAVNVTSPYTAAVQAVKLWSTLPDTVSKTFLFTGNMTSTQLWPISHTLGMGKNATAYWIETAAATYKGKYKFYFVDERTEEGETTGLSIDGEAHAVEFWRLAEEVKEQSHWNWTFVKGKGYVRNKAAMPDRELRVFGFQELPEGGMNIDDLWKLVKGNPEAADTLAAMSKLKE